MRVICRMSSSMVSADMLGLIVLSAVCKNSQDHKVSLKVVFGTACGIRIK